MIRRASLSSPRDDRENVVGLRSQVDKVEMIVDGGVAAESNNGWWVDTNDNVWAPGELPTLVLDNGQETANG